MSKSTPKESFDAIEREIRRTIGADWRKNPSTSTINNHARLQLAIWINDVLRSARASYLGQDFVALQLAEDGGNNDRR